MKLRVLVYLRPGVLDPEGEDIAEALRRCGFEGVQGVRAGRVYEIEGEGGVEEGQRMAAELLTNPVLEVAQVELLP